MAREGIARLDSWYTQKVRTYWAGRHGRVYSTGSRTERYNGIEGNVRREATAGTVATPSSVARSV